jgi:hypothetical protein
MPVGSKAAPAEIIDIVALIRAGFPQILRLHLHHLAAVVDAMSRQLEIFEGIAEQNAFTINEGDRDGVCGGKIGQLSVSPGLRRAKVARPAPDSPVASVDSPEAIPDQRPPVLPRVVFTRDALVRLLRARKEELNVSHATIDAITGWPENFSSKALSPMPRKHLSPDTLRLVLDALALGVAAIVLGRGLGPGKADATEMDEARPEWPEASA